MSIRDNSPEGQRNRQKLVEQAMENWKRNNQTNMKKPTLTEYLSLNAINFDKGYDEFLLKIRKDGTAYMHPLDRSGETFDFRIPTELQYSCNWDDSGWWTIYQKEGDGFKVWLVIEGEENELKAKQIVDGLNNMTL